MGEGCAISICYHRSGRTGEALRRATEFERNLPLHASHLHITSPTHKIQITHNTSSPSISPPNPGIAAEPAPYPLSQHRTCFVLADLAVSQESKRHTPARDDDELKRFTIVRFWKVLASHSRIAAQKGKVGNLAARLCWNSGRARVGWEGTLVGMGEGGMGMRLERHSARLKELFLGRNQGIKRHLRRRMVRYITICFLL